MVKVFCKDCTIRIGVPQKKFMDNFVQKEPEKPTWTEFSDGYRCLSCASLFQRLEQEKQKKKQAEFLGS